MKEQQDKFAALEETNRSDLRQALELIYDAIIKAHEAMEDSTLCQVQLPSESLLDFRIWSRFFYRKLKENGYKVELIPPGESSMFILISWSDGLEMPYRKL